MAITTRSSISVKAPRLRISINEGMDFIYDEYYNRGSWEWQRNTELFWNGVPASFPLPKWCCEVVFGPYCGVYGRVGLVAGSFQFFTRLAAVFADEGGGFEMFAPDGPT